MTIRMRPYAGETDLPLIADLVNACEEIDRTDEGTSVDELRRDFANPRFDQGRDFQLWITDDNTAVGFGKIRSSNQGEHPEGFLWFKIHPVVRSSGIEEQIFAWAMGRLREIGQNWGVPLVRLIVQARDDKPEELAMLGRYDFAVMRFFMRMERPLDTLIPTPQFPEGFLLRHVAGEHEMEAWVEMFNQSFIDHWNHHPLTVEVALHHIQTDPHYQRERDLIAVAPDGTFAAFCDCSINSEENERNGRNDGWINLLGTRRGFRNIGLGRAMVLAGLQRLAADGATMALLGVDAANPSGATRLYESLGFHKQFAWVVHSKDVEVGTADQKAGTADEHR